MPLITNKLMSEESQLLDSKTEKWMEFNNKLQYRYNRQIPEPFKPVMTLVTKYLKQPSIILDIGCETGKNAACLIRHGHKVILLDIASNAIFYTKENLARECLDHGIVDDLNIKIEDLPSEYGPFDAVVGTYAFSFIPPDQFEETMINNILSRIRNNGYFVGSFFGSQHAWANKPNLTILNSEKLQSLFSSVGFSIVEIQEEVKEIMTVSGEMTKFHTMDVIAQRL